MEQIVKTVGTTETKYTDVSEDAKGAGMTKVGWVRQDPSYHGDWIATRIWAGLDAVYRYPSRELAEQRIERSLEGGTLISTITVR